MSASGGSDYLSQVKRQAREILDMDAASYLAFFQNAPIGMVVIDPASMRVLAANPACLKLLGYSQEELIGKTVRDLTYPGDPVITKENVRDFSFDSTELATIEKRYLRKNGEVIWSEVGVSVLKRGDGKPDLLIGTLADITDRKLAEERLKSSDAFYRMAVKSARMGGWSIDAPGMKIIWSNEACDILEVPHGTQSTLEQAIEYFPSSLRGKVAEMIARCKEGGIPFDEVFQIVTRTGKRLAVRVLGNAIRDGKGEIARLQGSLQDISTIKGYDEKLHENQDSMRLFIEHAPAAIAMFDSSMRYIAVSRRWMNDYGLEHADITGKSHYEIFPDIPERWKAVHQRALNGEIITAQEDRFERADGSVQWLNWEVRPWFRAGREIAGIVVLTEDITERKQAMSELLDRQFKLDAIVGYSPSALSLKTPDGRYALANPNLQRIHHMTEQEIIGRTDFDLYPEEIAAAFRANDEIVLSTMARHSIEERIPVDGVVRTYMSHMFPILNEQGSAAFICRISLDITESRHATEELKDLYDHAPLGYHSLDRNGVYTRVNDTELSWLGYTRDEVIGRKKWSDFVSPEDASKFPGLFEEFKQKGHARNLSYRMVRKNGTSLPVLLNATAIYDADGNYLASRGMMADVTERELAHESLLKSESRFQSLFENMNAGFVLFEVVQNEAGLPVDLVILAANGVFETTVGVKIRDVIGRRLTEVLPGIERDGADWIGTYSRVALTGVSGQFEQSSSLLGATFDVSAYQPAPKQCAVTFRDITEQRKTSDMLRLWGESFEKLHLALAMADATTNKFIAVNPAFANERGYTPQELAGKPLLSMFPDDLKETVMRNIALLDTQTHLVYESEHVTRDGRRFPVLLDITTILSPDGKPLNRIAYALNLTDLFAAQSQLRLWGELFEKADFGLAVTDAITQRFLSVNPAYAGMHGYERSELEGQEISIVNPDRAGVARMASKLANVPHLVTETEHITKDGRRFPVDLDLTEIREPDGRPEKCIYYVADATSRKKNEEKLREQDALFQEMSAIAHVGAWEFDPETGAGICTEEVMRIHELEPDVPMSASLGLDFYHGESRERIEKAVRNATELGVPYDLELELTTSKGRKRWIRTIANPVVRDGKVVKVRGAIQDITDRRETEAEMRLAAVAFQTQEGIMVTDADSVILRVNDAFVNITGYAPEECVGKTASILRSGKQDSAFYKDMWHAIVTTGGWEGELWNRRKNGEIYPERLVITGVRNEEGKIVNYVGTFTDITMNRASAEKIRDLAFYDTLTHLPNRRLFMDRLHQAMTMNARSGQKGALFLLDLDNFKTINDTLGHDMGDALLQQVAERIKFTLREEDTVARLGGDEFVILVADLGRDALEAADKARDVGIKLQSPLNQPYRLGTQLHQNSPSIGVTIFSGNERAEDLVKQADIAMYQAKRAGKNTLRFFDQQMQEAVNAHAALERDLRIALDRKQFELYYQIQVDNAGRAIGAEALIRWNHPERGLVSPGSFIPVAEDSGLIVEIGDWVLEQACIQLKAWEGSPDTRDLVLAVNLSSASFRPSQDFDVLLEIVKRHRINPTRLKIEITESLLLDDVERITNFLRELKAIGIRLAMDDFGTGYSSLSYLKRLPIDQVKIDQSFVRDIAEDENDRAIVETIIAMARSLKMGVIAEGVETDEQKEFLIGKGCMAFQGYLFGKPLPLDQFETLLTRMR